ncbi:metal ABC transporter substrate-binding protein [Natronolimnobius baerhuensis]|uniref:Zinc ABC transporter substrate-binding protein n=1 Tax=Natronolimnobius baerhuensis TaxID=253108 RepID=A0A202E8G7_9EURY|nr:zinc ABC transporter substrate-binding protein [Natronolimnobius baerhuensis]OVE84514.1 zinc ABC transporter substrate-binding protein [Natronolimnobius baerhuensis]
MDLSRRATLTGGGALALGALAGCMNEPSGNGTDSDGTETEAEHSGYAAFFTLWDWAEHVAGDHMTFTNPVATGEMGHGWEPPVDIQRDIADTDAFIYLDTAEFAWAQDIAAGLEADYDDISVIDVMDGLESSLLPIDRDAATDRTPETDHEYDPDSMTVGGFEVYNRQSGEEIAYWHTDHWHGGLPEVPVEGYAAVEGVFEDDEGRVLPLGDDSPFEFDARVLEGADDDVLEIESQGDHIEFHGLEAGRTRIAFELVADGEVIWDTSEDSMTADVVDELDESDVPEFYDPHVWIDPVLAQDVVETIADGLAEIDPDNADAYADNAAAYIERLEDVDRQFEELAAEAERDVAVLAGHDAFQYLEHRYDFEIHTPVGISPDAAESQSDIAEAIDIVEEHDIETVLYDPFETPNPDEDVPQMVEVLLENTGAENYEPLTPAEGTTAEWTEQEWGWVEQMEAINIPSLRAALGAE